LTQENQKQNLSISVVIPAYNIEKYIGRAIDSVLTQTHKPDEIIVVDDGSTDGTAAEIKKFGDKVKYIYQQNAGLPAARNTGIKAATGTWIAFLDGDDQWLPKNLMLQTKMLQRNPDLVWSTGNFHRSLPDENRCSPHLPINQAQKLLNGKDYFDDYFDAYMLGASGNSDTMIIRRDVLHEVGLFREDMPCAEDADMWFRLAMCYPKIGYAHQPIAVYYLSRPDSIINVMKTIKRQEVICNLFERSLKLAAEHGRMEKFLPCLVFCLRRRIRSNLFEHKMAPANIDMLRRFGSILPFYYKVAIRLPITFPRITAGILHTISKISRSLNLRRYVTRKPQR